MPDRSGEFRKLAAGYVAIAHTTSDPGARAILLTMAQKWFDLASEPALDAALRVPDATQMSDKPVMQQQQQSQPEKEDG